MTMTKSLALGLIKNEICVILSSLKIKYTIDVENSSQKDSSVIVKILSKASKNVNLLKNNLRSRYHNEVVFGYQTDIEFNKNAISIIIKNK